MHFSRLQGQPQCSHPHLNNLTQHPGRPKAAWGRSLLLDYSRALGKLEETECAKISCWRANRKPWPPHARRLWSGQHGLQVHLMASKNQQSTISDQPSMFTQFNIQQHSIFNIQHHWQFEMWICDMVPNLTFNIRLHWQFEMWICDMVPHSTFNIQHH